MNRKSLYSEMDGKKNDAVRIFNIILNSECFERIFLVIYGFYPIHLYTTNSPCDFTSIALLC